MTTGRINQGASCVRLLRGGVNRASNARPSSARLHARTSERTTNHRRRRRRVAGLYEPVDETLLNSGALALSSQR